MSRELALRAAAVAAVVAICAGGFFACFERRLVDVTTNASAEARRNRYLALGRLLEKMGHEVELHAGLDRLDELPEPPATVFFPVSRATLGAKRSQQLLDWVARGGHLVVVTHTVWEPPEDAKEGAAEVLRSGSRPDLLLDRFGLRQRTKQISEMVAESVTDAVESQQDGAAGEVADEAEESERPAPAPDVGDVLTGNWTPGRLESAWAWLDDEAEPLEVEFHAGFWWEDPAGVAIWKIEGETGAHLVEVEHGEGVISALTSDEPFVNDTIGRVENARFVATWLRHGRDRLVPVWIFYESEWPSLFELLRRHAAPALAAGALLLALWLWRSLARFGPLLPARDSARRSWLEHLEAAGRFHWRQDRGAALLAGLREELARELARKRPAWARLPERERLERLAQASALPLEPVAHALLGTPGGARGFTSAVRTLERVRAAL
jgi:hypothetical protein